MPDAIASARRHRTRGLVLSGTTDTNFYKLAKRAPIPVAAGLRGMACAAVKAAQGACVGERGHNAACVIGRGSIAVLRALVGR